MSGPGKRGVVVAIDGPSGVGKTTVSKIAAGRLKFRYADTGAMYRAFALAAFDAGVDLNDDDALKEFGGRLDVSYDPSSGGVLINGADYSGRIRSQRAGELASMTSARLPVRELLIAFQRTLADEGPVVMEGRDIGTVVFPDAEYKFFLDASHEVRAGRRHSELEQRASAGGVKARGPAPTDVSNEIRERDERDSSRANSPLRKADDAVLIDTGGLSIEDVVERIMAAVKEGARRQ